MKKTGKTIILVLTLIATLASHKAFAAEAIMQVSTTIVQCGPRDQIVQACQADSRCCGFVDGMIEEVAAVSAPQNDKVEEAKEAPVQEIRVATARDAFHGAGQLPRRPAGAAGGGPRPADPAA